MSPRVALVAVLVVSALGAFFLERPKPPPPIELVTLVGPLPTSRPVPLAGPALRGPGVIITLRDSSRKPAPDEDPYFFIVHDSDLTCLLQELSACGAEGLSINDHRVVFPGTSIRSVGPCITLDDEPLVQPYVVKAIGPTRLAGDLRSPNCWFDSMAQFQRSLGMVKAEEVKELTVPAFKSAGYRFATPIP